jgi:3-phosphoshikimate 1-carboxyvinyltransferase
VICAALSEGESSIENFGRSDDVDATLNGVRALGLAESILEGGALRIRPKPKIEAFSCGSAREVDCGESGSTLRFLLPVAALGQYLAVFTGRGRLLKRPLDVYAKLFAAAGSKFIQEADRVIAKGPLKSGKFVLPGNVSSQFVSGLLLALPLLNGDSEIRLSTPLESGRYVEMTASVMRRFGVEVDTSGTSYFVGGGQRYRAVRYKIEADYSQAAFFLAAAALGLDVRVSGLNPDSVQGDMAMLSILREMGADVAWRDGVVSVRAGTLSAVTVDAREIPDLVPPIASLCCFCEGTSEIVNAGRLRLKESDRLSALAGELGKLGAKVAETDSSLFITGAHRLKGGEADARGDHRIAMAMAVASIRCDGPVSLSGWQSVNKSYPGFWNDFEGGCG